MDITNTIRKYAECASGGAITEPTGGSWISALAIWQGSTEPLNSSWLQTVCDNYGITQPVDGSWLIALANYYGVFAPVNGSWSYAVQTGCEAGPPAPVDLIWDQTSTEWQDEEAAWAIALAPMTPTFDQNNQELASATTLTGMAEAYAEVDLNLNGISYITAADINGVWSQAIALPGQPSPGTQYTVTIIAKNMENGLISAEFQGLVFLVVSETTVTFNLTTEWSLYYYWAGMQVEQETSPGVWEPVEWEGNPTWQNGAKFYKVQPFINVGVSAGYQTQNVLSFRQDDESGTTNPGPIYRNLVLALGFNYRIVAVNKDTPNSPTNYGRFNRYSVYNGASLLLAEYDGDDVDWLTGNVQQTFTL